MVTVEFSIERNASFQRSRVKSNVHLIGQVYFTFAVRTPSDSLNGIVPVDCIFTHAILDKNVSRPRYFFKTFRGLTFAVQTLIPLVIFVKRIVPFGDL